MTYADVAKRRDEIREKLLINWNAVDISKNLGIKLDTVHNDIQYLRDKSGEWLNQNAKNGLVFEMELAINKIKELEKQARDDYGIAKDKDLRMRLRDQISRFTILAVDLFSEGPSIMTLETIRKEYDKMREIKPMSDIGKV